MSKIQCLKTTFLIWSLVQILCIYPYLCETEHANLMQINDNKSNLSYFLRMSFFITIFITQQICMHLIHTNYMKLSARILMWIEQVWPDIEPILIPIKRICSPWIFYLGNSCFITYTLNLLEEEDCCKFATSLSVSGSWLSLSIFAL